MFLKSHNFPIGKNEFILLFLFIENYLWFIFPPAYSVVSMLWSFNLFTCLLFCLKGFCMSPFHKIHLMTVIPSTQNSNSACHPASHSQSYFSIFVSSCLNRNLLNIFPAFDDFWSFVKKSNGCQRHHQLFFFILLFPFCLIFLYN